MVQIGSVAGALIAFIVSDKIGNLPVLGSLDTSVANHVYHQVVFGPLVNSVLYGSSVSLSTSQLLEGMVSSWPEDS